MNEKSWIFRRPSVVIACAIYLSAAILLLMGGVYYHYAEEILQQQRMDILDKTMQSAVQSINEEFQALQSTALSIRSRLRYVPMPDRRAITAEERLQQHDASVLMKGLLSSAANVQQAYLYSIEADYAITPNAVYAGADLALLYTAGGFAFEETDVLHASYTPGSLTVSSNGCQMAYLLSIGKDSQTSRPRRQLVLLLRRNLIQSLLSDLSVPDARYTLESPQGAVLERLGPAASGEPLHIFRYPLSNGCTLVAELADTGVPDTARTARLLYIAMVCVSLLLITGIAVVTCRFNHIPIDQLIEYIRKNYSIRHHVQGDNLTVLRDAVEDILESQSNAQYQLVERDEAQRWERIIRSLQSTANAHRWQGQNYVLMVFTPQDMDRAVFSDAVKALGAQADAHALLPLRDGMALLLGCRQRALQPAEAASLAESLLETLDNAGVVLRAAVSACHARLDDLPAAYREARMTLDCLLVNSDAPVLCYQDCDFQTGSFCLDAEYLSRQQHFSRLISQGKYGQAVECLDSLTSEVYEAENVSRSETGRMYLEMLKYQMMSCLDFLYRDSAEGVDLRRDAIRELLLCTSPQQVIGLVRRLLLEMAETAVCEQEEADEGDSLLTAIKQYVRKHFDDPQMSVAFLAAHFDMSPNSVSKLFSRKAGVGVLQYIHKIRIENACNLILNTDLSLTEIAQRVGYTTTLTFTRAFKARYHMSPSEWRRMNEEGGQ